MSFPDRQTVLDFLKENPDATTKADIARGLKVKGRERAVLREILEELEREGKLERTGKRSWAQADRPPPSSLVEFTRLTKEGDLVGQCVGDAGLFGPELIYGGPSGKNRSRAPAKGDRAICKIVGRDDGEWRAYVITLLEKRVSERIVGLFERGPRGGRVIPASRKERRELLIQEADSKGARDGDLVVAEPKPQGKRQYGPPLGIVKEIVGHITDARSASLIAIYANDIPVEFPEAVLKEAREKQPADVPRTDLTQTPLITIDPHDARDHDDAVYAEALEGGGWRVIVAIADVSAYVTEGSALDKEAEKRGNSTYFPDRVVPMLPFELSADACSLKEGELRPCLAVEMIFSKDGHKQLHKFLRANMRSAAKLAYEEAQAAIDGKPGGKAGEILETVLKPLWGAYAAVSKARDLRSPLDLDMPERRIQFSAEGEITGIVTKERLDAHRLIEEFMIQANVAAAETLEQKKSPVIYRVHDTPSDAKIAAFAEFLQTLDMKWTIGERPQTHKFNKLLAEIKGGDYDGMISQMVLRTQAQAIYSEENLGHFGLNLPKYAHFTSPIRRYADLVVHRALITAHDFGPDGLSERNAARLEEIASHISMTERRSMAAERDATDRYLAIFLADRVGAEFEGRITGVTGAGLFVALAGSGADGFVPISSLSDDYWVHDEAAMAVYSRGSGKTFSLGQIVRVRLLEVTPLQGGLLLEMLSEPMPAPKGRQAIRKQITRESAAPRGRRGGPPRKGKPKFDKRTLPKRASGAEPQPFTQRHGAVRLAIAILASMMSVMLNTVFDKDEDGVVIQKGVASQRPKDAATLILVRRDQARPRVLMGKRAGTNAFMPDKYVFPGGRVDPQDGKAIAWEELRPEVEAKLRIQSRRNPRAFALTAIRETFEETGLIVGRPAEMPPACPLGWEDFHRLDVAPDLSPLTFIGRAVTPPYRPRRFDARFFMAEAEIALIDERPPVDGAELSDLQWVTLDDALKLDLPSVTRFMLGEIAERLEKPDKPLAPPFLRWSRGGHQTDRL